LWFFYYMREPHDNYRLSPVDEHWDKTDTWHHLRRWQLNFHKHYGDLFTRLVSTRVTFVGEAYGGGKKFTPNGLVSKIEPDKADHPVLIGEFADAEERRYVMVVNNSMSESVNVRITFPGADVKTYSWDWHGEEKEGGAYCCGGAMTRDEAGMTGGHWLAPGQEFVYRVESSQAAQEPILAE
jgi:3'-phosphoadenosine 5'-phosphosulfate sulfotransferase (PAPS reductase)/FAD synthetase